MKDIIKILDEADVVIAQNGDRFDIKKINARLIFHHLTPPSPYKTIDTLKIARQQFSFTSNRLDDLGKFLGVGKKVKTGGFDLWDRCLLGNRAAWRKMCTYNKRDVVLLEKVYKKLRPWAKTHPDILPEKEWRPKCTRCGGKLQFRGVRFINHKNYQRYQCQSCGFWDKKVLKSQRRERNR